VTIAAVVGAVIVAMLFASLSGKPSYSVLFSNLQPQDAASITQQLTTDHVPYQLQNGGATILVPQNDVAQARLTAAAAGLPAQSTVGLSLLTKTGLTTSQITQQADYLQAIQGELEQTIDAITGVQASQVNVAEAANQTFALNNTHPSGASVLVTMAAGHTLTNTQVQAIVHLVASSVPGLDATDVTVANNSGALLSGPGVSATVAANSETAAYDATVQSKVAGYLSSIFTPNNADVQVTPTLNFKKVSQTPHQLAPPLKGAAASFCTSTQTSSTKATGKATLPGGPAGAVVAPAAKTGAGKYLQTQSTKSCETGTETTTTVQAPGSVVKQTVAVLVNAKAVPAGATMAAIRAGVAAAASIQPTRGDVLSFTVAPFSTAGAAQAAQAAKAALAASKHAAFENLIKEGAALLAVLVLIALIIISARRKRLRPSVAMIDPARFQTASFNLPSVEMPTAQVSRVGTDRTTTEIEQFIEDQPNEVASVLRSWLRRESQASGSNE
jgi:flagellar M-ring protein FliF